MIQVVYTKLPLGIKYAEVTKNNVKYILINE